MNEILSAIRPTNTPATPIQVLEEKTRDKIKTFNPLKEAQKKKASAPKTDKVD